MHRFCGFVLVLFGLLWLSPVQAQQTVKVSGRVTDTLGKPLDLVNIVLKGSPQKGVTTDESGTFTIILPVGREVTLVFSCVGFVTQEKGVRVNSGMNAPLLVSLQPSSRQLPQVVKKGERYVFNTGVEYIDAQTITHIPALGSGIEGLIKTSGLGVHSHDELSSQYNVRGGSYDENLVYVNGIEVFRPLLIRSGQQEGLSFINPDMVSSVRFSSGGFASVYGDKTASVLDVDYAEPVRFSGSLSGSLLGASGHLGGISGDRKFSYLVGARYQSNAYMLKQMQTHGNYQPNFTDVQALLRYRPNDKWRLSLLGNFARNEYRLMPESGEATIGNILTTIQRLNIYYDGQEVDAYQTLFSSFAATWLCSRFSELTFSATYFRSTEKETFDINAEYWLSDINMDLGSESLGETISSRAVGGELRHGRNYLDADILRAAVQGRHTLGPHLLQWGISAREEWMDDRLEEWNIYDSSFYSLPHPYTPPGDTLPFSDSSRLLTVPSYLQSQNALRNERFTGFMQDQWSFGVDRFRYTLNMGLRFSYATLNGECFVTPRVRFSLQPLSHKNLSFYVASGLYYQPPFYKEMRTPTGEVNTALRSQKSMHFIVGGDWLFRLWEHPFKFSGETYYKYLWDLVSYELDNVRTIYSGYNDADGYAVGLDLKLSGEVVPGLESWLSVSLMQTMEDIHGDFYLRYTDSTGQELRGPEGAASCDTVFPGFIPRPTDQRFSVNMFFQDEIPNHPDFRAHINLIYSTPLPYGIVGKPAYLRLYRRGKAYFRTDVGFSWRFLSQSEKRVKPLSMLKAGYLTLEILNMFNYYNIISYTAVTDIDGNSYLTPNYLTPRLYNIKLRFEF